MNTHYKCINWEIEYSRVWNGDKEEKWVFAHWEVRIMNWKNTVHFLPCQDQKLSAEVWLSAETRRLLADACSQTRRYTYKPVIIHWVVWPSFSTHCLPKPFSWFPVKSNEIIPERHVRQIPGTEWGHHWRLPGIMWINMQTNSKCLL